MVDWLRWWHDTVSDTKFMWVARKTGSRYGDVIAVWAALLETASQSSPRGDVSRFDAEAFDCLLMVEDGTTAGIIHSMHAKKLIMDGRLAGWETRQPNREDSGSASALSSTERSRLHRARKRIADLEQQLQVQEKTPHSTEECNAAQHNATPRVDESRTEKNDFTESSVQPRGQRARLLSRVDGEIRHSLPVADLPAKTPTEDDAPERSMRICRLLRKAGITDAASHQLSEETWAVILSLRTDDDILAFAHSKLSARPGRQTSLRYLAPGLLEAPKSYSATAPPSGRSAARMNTRDSGRLAAARSIFGTGIESRHGTTEPAQDALTQATPGEMDTKALR